MPNISIDGKTCFYQDVGEGYPILLGHSFLWDSQMWEPQIKSLSKEFRCIAVDLWDHGKSDSISETHYTIERLAEDYWKLMQHLGIDEFAVVGLSIGGMWGTQLALNYPKAVQALVIMDTFVGAEPIESKQQYNMMIDFLENAEGFTDFLLDQMIPLFFSPSTLLHQKDLVENFRQALASTAKERIPGIATLGRAVFSRPCLLSRLPQLTQPTCVIVGKDDIPRPPKEAEMMAQRLLNAELHIVENAGHISNLEQPEKVTSLILDFLSQQKKFQKQQLEHQTL